MTLYGMKAATPLRSLAPTANLASASSSSPWERPLLSCSDD